MKYAKKFLKSIKRNGVGKTIKISCRKVYWKLFGNRNKNIIFDKYVNFDDYKNIIIFENNFGWKRLIKQRPQQIAENFGDGTLFVYHSHEDEDFKGCKKRINKLKNNLLIVDLGYFRNALFQETSDTKLKKFLMLYSTDFISEERISLYKENGFYLIYDYVDNIDKKLCGDSFQVLNDRHYKIVNDNSNIIITTAEKLYNNVINSNPNANVTLVTNGVNYDHFSNLEDLQVPSDMKDIRQNYKYIIGYYGALANWFDYKLVKYFAKKRKECAFVLIGLDYDGTLEKSKITELDNVFYLGKKEYDDLPAYVKYFDICTIPFLINDITLSTSPVKLFEYMAAHKPIVTTALPECKKYSSVFIANDNDDFVANIDKAIGKINNTKYIESLEREAKDNLWCNKCFAIEKVMDAKIDRKQQFINKLRERLDSGEIDRIIIWNSPFGWNVPLFQRPQHIAKALSNNRSLLIYEVTSSTDQIDFFDNVNDNLFLAEISKQIVIDTVLQIIDHYPNIPRYIQLYSTNWSMSGATMQLYIDSGFKIIYEYIDDLSPELAGTESLPEYVVEKYEMMQKDDENIIVVVTADDIEKDVLEKRGKNNYCFSCNGVDVSHFRDLSDDFKYDKKYLNILNNGKINLGYYGALAKWFDYDLIKRINDTDKYNIILFGIKYDDAYDKSGVDKLKNVHFMGPVEYKVLPYYAAKLDILSIPFVINSITNATSPLKLFEYMALAKPIVTTDMKECRKYKSVLIGKNHDEFLEKLEEATKLASDEKYMKCLNKEANENDWKNKGKVIIDLLKENE